MPFFADSGPLCELTTLRTNRFAFFFIQLMFWISFCFFVFAAPLCYTLFFVQEFHLLSLMPRQLLALLLPSWLSLCFALVFCFCFCVLFFFFYFGERPSSACWALQLGVCGSFQLATQATCNLQLAAPPAARPLCSIICCSLPSALQMLLLPLLLLLMRHPHRKRNPNATVSPVSAPLWPPIHCLSLWPDTNT